jgi:hypothetical protein
MSPRPLAYDAVPPALLALELLARQLRPRLTGELCIGAIGHDLQVAWWHARFGPRLETAFSNQRPDSAQASLLLGAAEADSLAQSGTLGPGSLVLFEGDGGLLRRFFEALSLPDGGSS